MKLSRLNLVLLVLLIILLLSTPVARRSAPPDMVRKVAAQEPRLNEKDIMANITQINVYDRVHADLDDWEKALQDIRHLIDLGEVGDEDAFIEARKKVTGLLSDMEQTRQFLKDKQALIDGVTGDASPSFLSGPQETHYDEHPEGPGRPGGHTSG